MADSIKTVLGPQFKGTVIEDPVLEPYFITNSGGGSFAVSKKRFDKNGTLRYSDVCFPSTFEGCLNVIAKEMLHEEGRVFESIQNYIDSWKEISDKIINAHKNWNVEKI